MAERHRTQGDVAFLLEPDLKEATADSGTPACSGPWPPTRPRLGDYVDLDRPSTPAVGDPHRHPGRAAPAGRTGVDRLLLQEQDHIAALLDYDDADALMAAVSEAGRTIAWAIEMPGAARTLWRPAAITPAVPVAAGDAPAVARRPGRGRARDRAGRHEVAPGRSTPPSREDSSLPFRLAAVAAEHDLPIARSALRRLCRPHAATARPVADRDPGRPSCGSCCRAAGDRGARVPRPAGILSRLLPEWDPVREPAPTQRLPPLHGRPTPARDGRRRRGARQPGRRPDLLVVGALLHDIGKGYPGDHTEVGVDQVVDGSARMGFSPEGRDVARDHGPPPPPPARRRDPTRPRRSGRPSSGWPRPSGTGPPSTCSARWPKPTAWPPVPRRGGRGRRARGRPGRADRRRTSGDPVCPSGAGWVTEGHHRPHGRGARDGPARWSPSTPPGHRRGRRPPRAPGLGGGDPRAPRSGRPQRRRDQRRRGGGRGLHGRGPPGLVAGLGPPARGSRRRAR